MYEELRAEDEKRVLEAIRERNINFAVEVQGLSLEEARKKCEDMEKEALKQIAEQRRSESFLWAAVEFVPKTVFGTRD